MNRPRRTNRSLPAGRAVLFLAAGLACARGAAAHDGGHAAWNVWTWAPTVTTGIALAAIAYGRGLWVLWRRAGVGQGVSVGQATAYAAGLATLVVALVSPVGYLSGALLSAHMVQHLLLLVVAAPLLVAGAPLFVGLWALPRRGRQVVARWWQGARGWHAAWEAAAQPLFVWLLYAVTLWVWHLPRLYEAALADPLVHDLQHLGFLVSAGLLWWVVLSPMGRLRLNRGAAMLYLFTTMLHGSALGVLITLSPRMWYPYYAGTAAAWGLTGLEDQQVAGVLMWMPACLVYIGLAAFIFTIWLRESEAEGRRLERYAARHAARTADAATSRYLHEAEGGG